MRRRRAAVAAGWARAETEPALAEELGGLPLALEQAASYVRATATTLAGFLALFRDRRAALLERGEPAGHPRTVAATLALALNRLNADTPAAAALLRLLASCAAEPVPLRLILQPRPPLARQLGQQVAPVLMPLLQDPLTVGDTVTALRRYSLATPAGNGLVLVHRLVQAITLSQMPDDLADQ